MGSEGAKVPASGRERATPTVYSGTAGWYREMQRRDIERRPSLKDVDVMARLAKAGNEIARRWLCEAMGSIVEAVVRKHRDALAHRRVDIEDARQEGMRAVLDALLDWQPEKATYRTLAFSRVRFAILDMLNGSTLLSMNKDIAATAYDVQVGRAQTEEAAQRSSQTRKTIEAAVAGLTQGADLDAPVGDGKTSPLDLLMEAEGAHDKILARLGVLELLSESSLTPKEREAVVAKYGLDGTESGMRGLAERIGLSPQAISLRAQSAERKIKQASQRWEAS